MIMGMCHICGKPTSRICKMCGRPACNEHLVGEICTSCMAGKL